MTDFGSPDRETMREIVFTLEALDEVPQSQLGGLLEGGGVFDSPDGIELACQRLEEKGEIERFEKDESTWCRLSK